MKSKLTKDDSEIHVWGRHWIPKITIGICLLISLSPILLYQVYYSSVPTIGAKEAQALLLASNSQSILVDVRPQEEFFKGHLSGSVNWPLPQILAISSKTDLPENLKTRSLLVICDGGIQSVQATRHLQGQSIQASHVHGGLQTWIGSVASSSADQKPAWVDAFGNLELLPSISLSKSEQVAAVFSSLMIKPVYMSLSLVLILILWRSRPTDLSALRWGIIAFLGGETACVFNTTTFFLTGQQSDLYEYLHGLGMILFLGFLFYALFDGLDQRIFHVTPAGRQCSLLALCRECVKFKEVPCAVKRLFLGTIPLFGVLSLMPLSTELHMDSFNTTIFGYPFNFNHPAIHQFYEIRILPLFSILFFTIAFFLLLIKGEAGMQLAKVFFASGMGTLGYSLLMLSLYTMYRDNLVWFIFWEEVTELLAIGAVGLTLWIFHRSLIPEISQSLRTFFLGSDPA